MGSSSGIAVLGSPSGNPLLRVTPASASALARGQQSALYTIVLVESGARACHVDATSHELVSPGVLFASPFQVVRLTTPAVLRATEIQFHGDFYCIEFHKHEVACNGLLFNNAYESPVLALDPDELAELVRITADLRRELRADAPAPAVLTAYLQLFLARASHIKRQRLASLRFERPGDALMEAFRELLERHVRDNLTPGDYAARLHVTRGTLARRCKQVYGKTPSLLIQERTILEAKKLLHLTRAPIKQIASTLGFRDEHYFSRFFKKLTCASPQQFRAQTGISVVADLSTQQRDLSMG